MQTLLYLARQHPPAVPESVMLRECVNQAAAVCRDEIARKRLDFELAIGADARVRLDRKARQINPNPKLIST